MLFGEFVVILIDRFRENVCNERWRSLMMDGMKITINDIPEEILFEYQTSPLVCHDDIIADIGHRILVKHIVRIKARYGNVVGIDRTELLNLQPWSGISRVLRYCAALPFAVAKLYSFIPFETRGVFLMFIATEKEDAEILERLIQEARKCEVIEKLNALFDPLKGQIQIIDIAVRPLDVEKNLDYVGYRVHAIPISFLKTLPIAFTISFS